MTTIQLNTELDNQLKLISGNKELMKKALEYLRSLTTHLTVDKKRVSEYEKTKNWLDSFVGKWEDSNTADEMIENIYSSRKNSSDEDIVKILNQ